MYDTSESLDNVNAVWDKPPFGLDLELNHVNVAGTEAEYQGDGRGSQKIFNAQGRSNQILNLWRTTIRRNVKNTQKRKGAAKQRQT